MLPTLALMLAMTEGFSLESHTVPLHAASSMARYVDSRKYSKMWHLSLAFLLSKGKNACTKGKTGFCNKCTKELAVS